MSKDPANATVSLSKSSRKQITKVLSTGQKISLTPQDERTLKGIYDYMAGYAKRVLIERAVEEKKREVDLLKSEIPPGEKLQMQERASYTGSPTMELIADLDDELKAEGTLKVENYYKAKEQRLKLEEKLKLYMTVDHKICFKDVDAILRSLGRVLHRRQIEQMIWEVDENLDGCLDWAEFRLMFNRNVTDQSGVEPNRMYNLAQFLIYDKNRNGLVSVDETMNLLYARYGRGVMEQKLKELFGENMHEIGRQGGEITFNQYLQSVERVQMNMFLETNRGRKVKKQFKDEARK
mmetsp:Transcript_20156/g.45084  ORF Transcript_20156/g.45084 Transcript_20156/m.45084 type:complete len:293 (-) Transcript_20156:316-1194(-)